MERCQWEKIKWSLFLLLRPMCLTQHLNWHTIGVRSPKMWKMSFLTVIALGGYISRWHYIEPYIAILSSPTPYRGPVIAARHLYQWMTSCSNRLEAVIVSKHITVATYISLFDSPSLHSPYKYLPFLPSSPSSLSSSSPLFPICYHIQIFSKVISSSWVICPMFKVISRRCSQQKILDGDLFGHTGMLTPYERSETIFSDPQLTSYPDKNGNKSSHSQNYRD